MPTHTGKDSKGCFAQWGSKTKYYYTCGNAAARKKAVSKANKQGQAAYASGYRSNAMFQYVTTNIKPLVRHESMEDKDWLVAPTQMITEGVHNGSDGPIFYPANELAKIANAWNHKPVVVFHPEVNGESVSACDPDQLSARKVGILLNTKWDGANSKLGTETWLNPTRIQTVDERVGEAVANNEMMEVSTGLYMNLDRTPGVWNGQEYIGVAREMQPDHLALLPDQKGACSIEDGAGFLRVNQSDDGANIEITDKDVDAIWINRVKGIKAITHSDGDSVVVVSYSFNKDKWTKERAEEWVKKNKGVASVNALIMNELSHDTLRSLINGILRTDKEYAWVEDVFDDFFIYEDDGKMYKQSYTEDKGIVSLEGLPKLVEKQVTYEEVSVLAANKNKTSKQKGVIMKKEKIVDALIANEHTSWEEEHREKLLALDEDVLTNMLAPITTLSKELTEATKNNEEKGNEGNEDKQEDKATVNVEAKAKTMDEYINEAPPEVRESLRMSVNTMNAEKSRLIGVIMANKQNTFTEDFLKLKTVEELRGIAQIAAPIRTENEQPAMFLGQEEVANQGALPEPLLLPQMKFNTPTAKAS
jgi:hypothetical protein